MPARPLKSSFLQGVMSISSFKKEELGTLRIEDDGRAYRYAKAGSSALSAGKMGVCAAAVANHIDKAPAANVAVGAKSLTITVGATAVTDGQYAGGYLQVNDGTGEGLQFLIESNSACDASGTTTVFLADPITVALTTTGSEVSLIPNPWNGVTETATEENVPAGIAPCAVTAGSYYWAQVSGVSCALINGTPAVGTMLTLSSNAGSLGSINSTLDVDQPVLGKMLATAGVSGEYKPVLLSIL